MYLKLLYRNINAVNVIIFFNGKSNEDQLHSVAFSPFMIIENDLLYYLFLSLVLLGDIYLFLYTSFEYLHVSLFH